MKNQSIDGWMDNRDVDDDDWILITVVCAYVLLLLGFSDDWLLSLSLLIFFVDWRLPSSKKGGAR